MVEVEWVLDRWVGCLWCLQLTPLVLHVLVKNPLHFGDGFIVLVGRVVGGDDLL